MATGYVTRRGVVIKGALGEALAKATGRGFTYDNSIKAILGGSGGGGSSSKPPMTTIETPTSSADEILKQKQAEASRKAIELARQRASKEAAKNKAFREKIAKMNARQKQVFFQQQGELARAYTLQKIKEKGGKLNPQAEKFYNKVVSELQSKTPTKIEIKSPTTNTKNTLSNIASKLKSPKVVFKTIKDVGKLLLKSTTSIPTVIKDYSKSLGKGTLKVGLYIMDESGAISQLKINKNTGKLYIPKNAIYISQSPKLTKVKKWADYDFKNNPFLDPDYQNVGITTGFALLGVTSPATATKAFGVVKGKAVWDAIKNPTSYNVAVAESLFLPEAIRKTRKIKARGDILVAESGELVPLKERITQVNDIVKKSGKQIEAITAKPSKKAGITNIKSKTNPDYTYGKKIEFATYKVGKAYPTSEYFLKGKGTRLQKLLKTGRVNIEKIDVARINKKYGKTIKNTLLKKGKMPEAFIKKYFYEAKIEANKRGKPVAVISPKRLRGFWQAEQELVKVFPDGYKPKKLKFAGYTETGHKVYTDKGYVKNIKSFLKSKVTKGKIEKSYFGKLTKEKLEYLKGRPAIKGEYAEHGLGHLTAKNIDPYAKKYARNLNVKKLNNVFKLHDLAKVSDVESFSKFEHGQILKDLWKAKKFPDKNIYNLPKKLQKQIIDSYAGHTSTKPRFIDTLKKGYKDNSVVKDLRWYIKNKRNPYLQDVLTLDRLELPRAGRWNFRVNYKLLDKKALKRIYGSEENAIKNIRFLDWKTVPKRLKIKIRKTKFNDIIKRDSNILKELKLKSKKIPSVKKYTIKKKPSYKLKKTIKKVIYKPSVKKYTIKKKPSYKLKKTIKKVIYKPSIKKYNTKKITYKKSDIKYSQSGKPYIITPYGSRFIGVKGYPRKEKISINIPIKEYSEEYSANKYFTVKKPPVKPPIISKIRVSSKRKKRLTIPKSSETRKTKQKKTIPVFDVYGKSNKKFIKLNVKPLKKNDALSRGAFAIDNTTAKTFKIVPAKNVKKAGILNKKERNYFNRAGYKLREYKIRKGRAFQIKPTYIEKRKYGIDTRGEKEGLTIARYLRGKRPTRKRKITSTQRKVQLKNLAKARRIKKLKGGRR